MHASTASDDGVLLEKLRDEFLCALLHEGELKLVSKVAIDGFGTQFLIGHVAVKVAVAPTKGDAGACPALTAL